MCMDLLCAVPYVKIQRNHRKAKCFGAADNSFRPVFDQHCQAIGAGYTRQDERSDSPEQLLRCQ
eukprot:scaffold45462_cov28-Attheya_sp.AAC.3